MALKKAYGLAIFFGWGLFGLLSYLSAYNFIGGAAAFFILVAFASWSIFPLTHFLIAYLLARKTSKAPSPLITVMGIAILLVVLAIILMSSLFNYV